MFSAQQKNFIQSLGLNVDFDNLTDDDYVRIEDLVGDELVKRGLDKDYNPTSIGEMCEAILDQLP